MLTPEREQEIREDAERDTTFAGAHARELLAEISRLREELRIREESQIPVIPRAAQVELDRLRGELGRWKEIAELEHGTGVTFVAERAERAEAELAALAKAGDRMAEVFRSFALEEAGAAWRELRRA